MADKIVIRDKVTKEALIIIEGDKTTYTEAYNKKKGKKEIDKEDEEGRDSE